MSSDDLDGNFILEGEESFIAATSGKAAAGPKDGKAKGKKSQKDKKKGQSQSVDNPKAVKKNSGKATKGKQEKKQKVVVPPPVKPTKIPTDYFPPTKEEQVQYLNNLTRSFHPELTDLELVQWLVKTFHFRFIEEDIIDQEDYTTHGLFELLDSQKCNYKSNNTLNNAVRILFLTLSADRCIALSKQLHDQCDINYTPHVFASTQSGRKQELYERQKAALTKNTTSIAVATPGRILKLLEDHALDMNIVQRKISFVVIDMYCDVKMRSVMSMNETKKDLMTFVKDHLCPALRENESKLKIAFLKD